MRWKIVSGTVVVLAAIAAAVGVFVHGHNLMVLSPKGIIANRERALIITATLLMLLVVLPVFALTIGIVWRYRADNLKAKYSPDFDHICVAETIWWAIPGAIILGLAVITWQSAHALAPYRPLASSARPLTIQVVALDWKWLFIYPGQNVASVNQLELPVGTPVNFEVTSDAPMNSFWIPQLGGQIYAMPGMSTQLHLQADQAGNYYGSSANISGAGFAGMHFLATAVSSADFNNWVWHAQSASAVLNQPNYNQLAKPSQNNPVAYFSAVDPELYSNLIMKYMMPMSNMGAGDAR